MIYECTDCQNCASFDDGYRVYCLSEKFSADEVYFYYRLGDLDAKSCWGFKEGTPVEFCLEDHDKMLKDLEEIQYEAIRAWCIAHKR